MMIDASTGLNSLNFYVSLQTLMRFYKRLLTGNLYCLENLAGLELTNYFHNSAGAALAAEVSGRKNVASRRIYKRISKKVSL